MLIFSTIAAIVSPIIYLIPFIFLWKNEGHAWYKIPKIEKEIKNKYVFIAKIILLIILSIAFAFTWPTKVMFYPVKVAIFILILLIIQFLTGLLLTDQAEKDRVADKIVSASVICWIILAFLGMAVGVGAGETNEKNVVEEPLETFETLQVEHISNGNVFFYDETDKSIEVISIADERLEIVLEENDSQQPYLEKVSKHSRYSNPYVKEKIIYDDMSTLNEKYILYVSESDLYR